VTVNSFIHNFFNFTLDGLIGRRLPTGSITMIIHNVWAFILPKRKGASLTWLMEPPVSLWSLCFVWYMLVG